MPAQIEEAHTVTLKAIDQALYGRFIRFCRPNYINTIKMFILRPRDTFKCSIYLA